MSLLDIIRKEAANLLEVTIAMSGRAASPELFEEKSNVRSSEVETKVILKQFKF